MQAITVTLGSSTGTKWIQGGSAYDIDIDNDGDSNTIGTALMDLSHLMSKTVGRQCPMDATYRVVGYKVGLRNRDDVVDNTSGALFYGNMEYYTPQKHRIDILQLARKYNRFVKKSDPSSAGGWFTPSANPAHYQGFRFNWGDDGEVDFATEHNSITIGGTDSEYNLMDLWNAKRSMMPLELPANALFTDRIGVPSYTRWACALVNRLTDTDGIISENQTYAPSITDDLVMLPQPIEVLGGLLKFNVLGSSTDDPDTEVIADPTGTIDDDYRVHVTLFVEGWTEW